MAGKTVRCPACAGKIQIPDEFGGEEEAHEEAVDDASVDSDGTPAPPVRQGWAESDHSNVNIWVATGIGLVIWIALIGICFALKDGYLGDVFFSKSDVTEVAKEGAEPQVVLDKDGNPEKKIELFGPSTVVNAFELLFFALTFGILIEKWKKIGHQKNAMLLDVLPTDLDREINSGNVGNFIDHVYALPARLRDSTMVNRIRKALEFFETRPNNQDVATLMTSQSDIDASRIQGSYSLVKVFLWAVPILGFIGTVLGLSAAIGAIPADSEAMAGAMGQVTGGLGSAFNTTLFGLVLSLLMSFPISSVQKIEEDNLNVIDTYCNENLLTRLNDGGGNGGGGEIGQLDGIAKAVAGAQKEFLVDLNDLTKVVKDNADNLEKRAAAHQEKVEEEFQNVVKRLSDDTASSVTKSAETAEKYLSGLDTGIRRLNEVLEQLGEKQVVVQQVKKKGWFS